MGVLPFIYYAVLEQALNWVIVAICLAFISDKSPVYCSHLSLSLMCQ